MSWEMKKRGLQPRFDLELKNFSARDDATSYWVVPVSGVVRGVITRVPFSLLWWLPAGSDQASFYPFFR
jgi:hypothetical protein